ncbi:MAG: MFS transporter [Leptospirales bacterium]|nr:MFS transporter [Leptospirales bacterium]
MPLQKLWTKDFIFIMTANMFIALVFYVQLTTLALYSTKTYNVSASLAGFTATLFVLGAVFGRIFAGRYIELIGRSKFIYIGSILFFLISFAYFIGAGIGVLLAVRIIHGILFGILSTTICTLVSSYIPKERKGEGIGFFSLSITLGTAVGPFIGIFIMQHYNYNVLLGACSVFALCSLILFLFVKITNIELSDEQRMSMKKGLRFGDFFEAKALPLSVIFTVFCICYSSVVAFVGLYSEQMGEVGLASIFFIVYAVFILLSRPVSGKLLDKKGDNIVMYPAIIFFSAALFSLGIAGSKVMFFLSAVLLALGFGNLMSLGQTIAIKSVPQHRVGIATSTFFVCADAGMGTGAAIMGLIVPWKGYSGMYIMAGGIVLLSIILYYFLHGKHSKKLRES